MGSQGPPTVAECRGGSGEDGSFPGAPGLRCACLPLLCSHPCAAHRVPPHPPARDRPPPAPGSWYVRPPWVPFQGTGVLRPHALRGKMCPLGRHFGRVLCLSLSSVHLPWCLAVNQEVAEWGLLVGSPTYGPRAPSSPQCRQTFLSFWIGRQLVFYHHRPFLYLRDKCHASNPLGFAACSQRQALGFDETHKIKTNSNILVSH